jgi:riboflavin transporter FmnP
MSRRISGAEPLLTVTAILEVGAGVALLVVPALVLELVVGSGESPTGAAMGRLAGAAILSLGAACWWARRDSGSHAARGLVGGLLTYNATVVALVLWGSLGAPNPILWAAVVVHGVMALWCMRSLWIVR